MNITLKRTLTIATLAAALFMPATAATMQPAKVDLSQQMLKARHYDSRLMHADNTSRRAAIAAAQARMDAGQTIYKAPAADEPKPSVELKNMNYCGDIDAPDGSLWFYAAHNTYEKIVYDNEYLQYTSYILTSYSFDIYDSHMNLVGTVSDKFEYGPDEVKVVMADIAPIVTRSFFNNDDKYEVMVGLAVNTKQYVNRNYLKVYSIGGEKKDGYDVPVLVTNNVLGDVLNASTDIEENVYMTFFAEGNDYQPKDENDTLENINLNFWEKYMGNYTLITTYAKAQPGTAEPVKVFERTVRMAQFPGDMGGSPVFFSGMYDGKPRFVINSYDQPFFNRYDSFDEETTQRDNNALTIEVMGIDGKEMKTLQTTRIPVSLDGADDVISSFYSVGSFKYRDDVNYADFGTGDKAGFVITRQNYMASTDSYAESFFVYDADGTRRMTLYENADSHISLADIDGHDPQELFSRIDDDGDYLFEFVNLRTGKVELSMPVLLDIGTPDLELLSFNLDRAPSADGYSYACELRVPSLDENENDIMRIVWFDRNGKYLRLDQLNMGQSVEYAQSYIESSALDPKFFHSDDNPEYMLLIKRNTADGSLREELVVAQAINNEAPNGRTLLTVLPDEEFGALASITPFNTGDGNNRLVITFKKTIENQEILAQKHYRLPLDGNSGIGSIAAPDNTLITVEDNMLIAPGTEISIYSTAGAMLAKGYERVSAAGLASGIYIARAGSSSLKFHVK